MEMPTCTSPTTAVRRRGTPCRAARSDWASTTHSDPGQVLAELADEEHARRPRPRQGRAEVGHQDPPGRDGRHQPEQDERERGRDSPDRHPAELARHRVPGADDGDHDGGEDQQRHEGPQHAQHRAQARPPDRSGRSAANYGGRVRWLAFGTYDVQAHPRVAVLLEGLAAHGEPVDEVVEPLGLSTADRVDLLRPALAAARPGCVRLGVRWARLVRAGLAAPVRRRPAYDAVLVGYLGHFDVLLARALLARSPGLRHPRRAPPVLVLDHLVSAAGTAPDRGLAAAAGSSTGCCAPRRGCPARGRRRPGRHRGAAARADRRRGRAQAVVVPVGATQDWFAAGAAPGRLARAGAGAGRCG